MRDFSGRELVAMTAAAAVAIAEGKTPEEIEVLAEVLSALGDNLSLIAVKEGLMGDAEQAAE